MHDMAISHLNENLEHRTRSVNKKNLPFFSMLVNHYGRAETSKKVTTNYFDHLGPLGVIWEEITHDSFANWISFMSDSKVENGVYWG